MSQTFSLARYSRDDKSKIQKSQKESVIFAMKERRKCQSKETCSLTDQSTKTGQKKKKRNNCAKVRPLLTGGEDLRQEKGQNSSERCRFWTRSIQMGDRGNLVLTNNICNWEEERTTTTVRSDEGNRTKVLSWERRLVRTTWAASGRRS